MRRSSVVARKTRGELESLRPLPVLEHRPRRTVLLRGGRSSTAAKHAERVTSEECALSRSGGPAHLGSRNAKSQIE